MSEKAQPFAAAMQEMQVAWRRKPGNVRSAEWGSQNGRQYEHILPRDQWEENLWEELRSGRPNALSAYLGADVQAHEGKNNLKSSWVLCANLYFPFGQGAEGRGLLAGFLHDYVTADVETVDELDLEFAEDGELHPAVLLGEVGGRRGSGQTSPDLALKVNGGRGLILIESKLTEHSFYPCSARRKEGTKAFPGNPDPDRCLNTAAILADHAHHCHQCQWGRKYWDVLRPAVNEPALCALTCCPAAQAGYQLFRQQALAEGIVRSGKYGPVYSCVAFDARNAALKSSLTTTGIANWASDWRDLFSGKSRFGVFTHQDWVAWVARHGNPARWGKWMDYVTVRYGYECGSGRQENP